MFLASNWYFFMAASTGKEIKPRNPRKRKVNRDFFIHTQRERERGFKDLSLLSEALGHERGSRQVQVLVFSEEAEEGQEEQWANACY